MSDKRIRIPKDKEHIIDRLLKGENDKGVFNLKADVMIFAASIGYKNNHKIPFSETMEPIRQEVFESHGYDTVINLLAIGSTKDPKVLMNSDEAEQTRLSLFEEYANGGLEILSEELRGTVNILEHILLMMKTENSTETESEDEFILSRFL